MSSTSSPTVSRRWLALEMRRLRLQARMPQAKVAKALGCQVPKISLMENGGRLVREEDLKILLELFDVPDDAREPYVDEAANARERGWWELEPYDNEDTVPPHLGQFLGLEQGAERIRAYQTFVVHGLLQTAEYASALIRGLGLEFSEEKIDRLVGLRLLRQDVVRASGGTRLWVIMDEAALRHLVGSRAVMRAQLDHVVDLAHAHENVTVQVVPFDRSGAYRAGYGPFTILSFSFRTDPGLVYMEHREGAQFLDGRGEIDSYSVLFRQLSELALTPEGSLAMLGASAREFA
jgi:transcriptional regulator with XRE-family HTH domain